MKNSKLTLLFVTILITVSILFYCCSKTESSKKPNATALDAKGINSNATTASQQACGSCGAFFSGRHSGTGFFVYTPVQLDLSCANANSTVTLGCVYYDVPNAFDVLDKNGNVVVSTGWIGNANCPGPWGQSINTLQATTYIHFSYNPTLAPYKLRVQTTVIGCSTCGSNNVGCTSNDDTWDASVSCSGRNDNPGGGTPNQPCGSCWNWYNGTHSGKGSYVYPSITLDLSCAKASSLVSVGCVYYDVPDAFDILDKNGNVVISTGWIGNANCSGPWGSSINTLQAETYIKFTYNASLAPYKLRVQTAVIGCSTCGPNNVGCTSNDDNWGADVSCVAK